jgi:hypothetical protein
MLMQMDEWNQLERRVRWSDVFHHVRELRLYLLLKSIAMVKQVVPFGELVLTMGQYVRSTNILRGDPCFNKVKKRHHYSYSLLQRSIKRLESSA